MAWRYVPQRRHSPTWFTPYARGHFHGILIGAAGAVALMMAAKYLL